ncbi:protein DETOXIFICATION 29-like isoform X2 [Actinidia eriantha]|uniref:protein DETOXIFICATION 29-like isoform X2 n=1 Tax=Actinidia eriantha TaxID=165200 RepID=UPI002591140B|nr:protein DETOXIFICATION 29-like isoform X2 [Actinidia eriantha]
MENGEHPLLSTSSADDHNTFLGYEYDAGSSTGGIFRGFLRVFWVKSKKLWYLASAAIFTYICQYSLGAITQIFAGNIGTSQLAAISVENSIIAGFACGIMWGMGSGLETLCGISFGAGQLNMLGIYLQRSWVILNTTALMLMFLYIFATPILKFIGQTDDISEDAGTFALWMIPQLFAYAMNYPLAKFLQAQNKFMVMAVLSAVALVLHAFFSWLLILKLEWGMVWAAVMLNLSWWFIVLAQLLFILHGGCGRAWTGFSWMAFQNLSGFFKLSLASAIMLALESWYTSALTLLAAYLTNAELSVDASAICANILGWTAMVGSGLHAATSVRVSNELGAIHPGAAKFSTVVVGITSFLVGLFLTLILIITGKQYPSLFSNDNDVRELVYQLTPLLGLGIVVYNLQLPLAGVAIGAGWQAYVAYVNFGCYYLFGIPMALLLGFKFNMGIQASKAGDKLKQWGGEIEESEI